MDESQEQLLKRLTLLKQKIRELYPELSVKMAGEYLLQNCKSELNKKDTEDESEVLHSKIHKKSA